VSSEMALACNWIIVFIETKSPAELIDQSDQHLLERNEIDFVCLLLVVVAQGARSHDRVKIGFIK